MHIFGEFFKSLQIKLSFYDLNTKTKKNAVVGDPGFEPGTCWVDL